MPISAKVCILVYMIVARAVHSIFLYLLAAATYILGTTIAICFVPLAKKPTRPFQIAARWWAKLLLFFSGVRITTNNLSAVPTDRPLIIAVNHQSMADIIILLATVPVFFRFAIKKELFSIPVFGWYLRAAGYFPIDRASILSGYSVLKKMTKIMADGDSILIFPEGTRSRDGSLGAFRRASLLAAQKTGAPVLPVALSGSFDIVPRHTYFVKPTKVKVSFGHLVAFDDEEAYDKKVEEVRSFIAENL